MNPYDYPELWCDPQRIEENLTEITPESFFVYHRMTSPLPCTVQYVRSYWFDTLDEAIAYIKHVPLMDAITENGGIDKYMAFFEGINNVYDSADPKAELRKYLTLFNKEFSGALFAHEVHACFGLESFIPLKEAMLREAGAEEELENFLAIVDESSINMDDLAGFLLYSTEEE